MLYSIQTLKKKFHKLLILLLLICWVCLIIFFYLEVADNKLLTIEFKDLKIQYNFKEDPKLDCNGKTLLVIIPSRPNAFEKRMRVRNRWFTNTSSTVIYRFILGSTGNEFVQKENQKEIENFNDLIFTNIYDSYENLTLKTYAILQWQQKYCPNVEYLVKSDDDTVIKVSKLQYWIEKEYKNISKTFNDTVIFCQVWYNLSPVRDPTKKWYIPKFAYNKSVWPDFCSGRTYLINTKLIKTMINQTSKHYYLTTGDVFFTGIIADEIGLKRIDRQIDKEFRVS